MATCTIRKTERKAFSCNFKRFVRLCFSITFSQRFQLKKRGHYSSFFVFSCFRSCAISRNSRLFISFISHFCWNIVEVSQTLLWRKALWIIWNSHVHFAYIPWFISTNILILLFSSQEISGYVLWPFTGVLFLSNTIQLISSISNSYGTVFIAYGTLIIFQIILSKARIFFPAKYI